MTRVLEWLLSLDNIRWGRDAPLQLRWESSLPPWLLFGMALVAAAFVAAVYRSERGPAGRRILLGILRLALLALVVALLCGPSLVLEQNRTERSYTALLLDRSQSMARKELYPEGPLASAAMNAVGAQNPADLTRYSRADLIRAALLRNDASPLRMLLERNELQVAAFAADTEVLGKIEGPTEVPAVVGWLNELSPEGTATDLVRSIERTLSQAQGRRLAAIVLASDGQATVAGAIKDVIEPARGRQVPIYSIRVGSPVVPLDIEVGPVRADETVYLFDVVPIECDVRAEGLTEPIAVTLSLIDERTQSVASTAEARLAPDAPTASVEFRVKPLRVGIVRFRVQAPPLPGEQVVNNNIDFVEMSVLDVRLRVLYVEGYPRFEYRYFKNALLREPTVELSVLLLEADENFIQEGSDPIRRFPETPEELTRFDVVLFGDVDVRSGWLTAAQFTMLSDFVASDGKGFGIIAGERFAPNRFFGTDLEKLVPVRIDPEFLGHYDTTLTAGFRPLLTPEGRTSGLLRLAVGKASLGNTGGAASKSSEPDSSIPVLSTEALFETLPELFWIARTQGAKPGASVLLQHPTMRARSTQGAEDERMPILVTGRYGSGRLAFQATDETWRWRRHRLGSAPIGELLHDAYWVQLARMLSQPRKSSGDRRFQIRTDRRLYPYGVRVQVQVEVFAADLLARFDEQFPLTIAEVEGAETEPATSQAARHAPPIAMAAVAAHRRAPDTTMYDVAFTPPRPGRYVVRADQVTPQPGERTPFASFRVQHPDLEARTPQADHDVLQRLADGTEGAVLELDQLEKGFSEIRDRRTNIPDDLVEPLWDSKLAVILFAVLISLEWVLRKLFGLL